MLADAGVADQLDQRIYWADAPEGSQHPLAVLQKVSERRGMTLDGDEGLGRHLVQIDIYSPYHEDMRLSSEAVKKLWSGYSSAEIAGGFVQNIRETVERETGSHELLYRASLDILIIVKESEDE